MDLDDQFPDGMFRFEKVMKEKWYKDPDWPAKFVETTFMLGGEKWNLGTEAIGLDGDGWNQGFMETVQSDMEKNLKKVGATEIHSYGFID